MCVFISRIDQRHGHRLLLFFANECQLYHLSVCVCAFLLKNTLAYLMEVSTDGGRGSGK